MPYSIFLRCRVLAYILYTVTRIQVYYENYANIIQDKILMHVELSTFSVAKIYINISLYHWHLSSTSFKVHFKPNVLESRKVNAVSIRGMSICPWLGHGGSLLTNKQKRGKWKYHMVTCWWEMSMFFFSYLAWNTFISWIRIRS